MYAKPVDMMATDKEVLKHLFVNVLELEEADIKVLRKEGWWWYSKFAWFDKESGERVEEKITTVLLVRGAIF